MKIVSAHLSDEGSAYDHCTQIHKCFLWEKLSSISLLQYDMVISPGCVYNIHHYSGMICQFVCEVKKKHKHKNMEVIAAGGRYDAMITSYRTILEQANIVKRGVQQSAVGISLSMDRLVQVIQKDQSDDVPSANVVDVAVCSVGSKPMIKEKAKVGVLLLLLSSFTIPVRDCTIEG